MKLFVTSVHFLQTEGHIDSSVYLSLINAWHMILRTDTTNNDKDNLILKEW